MVMTAQERVQTVKQYVAANGVSVREACQKLSISSASYYNSVKKVGKDKQRQQVSTAQRRQVSIAKGRANGSAKTIAYAPADSDEVTIFVIKCKKEAVNGVIQQFS